MTRIAAAPTALHHQSGSSTLALSVLLAILGTVALLMVVVPERSPDPTAEAAPGGFGPVTSYKQQVFENALEGLRFEGGRVVALRGHARVASLTSDDAAQEREREGHRRMATHNNVLGALSAFTEAILLDPDEATHYVSLGEALLWKKKVAEAEAAFRTAVDLDPDLAPARRALAALLDSRANRDEAIAHWTRAVELDPDGVEAHSGLARSAYYAGRTALARLHASRVTALGSTLPAAFTALLAGGSPDRLPVSAGGGVTVGPQVKIDTSGTAAANETSAASVTPTPDEVVGTWNDYRSSGVRMGVSVSLDGGSTWTDQLLRPPVPNQSSVEGDPMTAFDPRTGSLWVGAISFAGNGGLYVAKKEPGQTTFEPSVQIGQVSFADKGWMAAGPGPGNPDSTRLYIAYNEGLSRSNDLGATWLGPVSAPSGLGFNPRVGPSGNVYIAYSDSNGVSLLKSLNGGTSLGAPTQIADRIDPFLVGGAQVPGTFRVAGLPAFAVDPVEEILYCIYPDSTSQMGSEVDLDLYFTKSMNRGLSWSTPSIIDIDQGPPGDQFFPWLEVDDAGTLHLVYYDTQNTAQSDTDTDGFIDAYYAYSTNRGNSWTRARLTPTPFNSSLDGRGGGDSFIGDYLGLAYAGTTAWPCYLSNQDGDADVYVNKVTHPPVPPLEITLTPLAALQMATLTVTGARPGTDVVIHWTRGGSDPDMGPCPFEYGGLCIDLIGNVKNTTPRTADGNGELSFTHRVPPIPPGREVSVQVVNILGPAGITSAKSNIAVEVTQ